MIDEIDLGEHSHEAVLLTHTATLPWANSCPSTAKEVVGSTTAILLLTMAPTGWESSWGLSESMR